MHYTPVRRDGPNGYQVDGYGIDLERGELYLAVCCFVGGSVVQSLNANTVRMYFRRVHSFFARSLESQFITRLEETSPAFEAAYCIYEHRNRIKRIRVVLLTNAVLSVRTNVVQVGELLGIPVSYGILDLVRYVHITESRGDSEPLEIDIVGMNGGALPCLEAHLIGVEYRSYLVALPAPLLARIYGLFGSRLLEQNVRAYLQARTKVNKGIIDTLRTSPEMFFAYNNGLTATAAEVKTQALSDGALGLAAVSNLQIVNGGQTTASILYSRDHLGVDLSGVFVQMKLAVIDSEDIEEIVSNISRFSNTQNRISTADFSSSHPYHVRLENLSRRVSAPPRPGQLTPTKWFYERVRGQYADSLAYRSSAERRRIITEFPKSQVINKTDFAKYLTTFECLPHSVSRGAQRCFLEFAERNGTAWQSESSLFDESYFRMAISKAIIFRETDRLVGRSDWYRLDRGYKANIVTYTIAWLVYYLRFQEERQIDLDAVWRRQSMSRDLGHALLGVARCVSESIKETPAGVRNVSEYAKQERCWLQVRELEIVFDWKMDSFTISFDDVRCRDAAERVKVHRTDDVDVEKDPSVLLPVVSEIRRVAKARRLLSPKSLAALDKVERSELPISRSEFNALRHLLRILQEKGFDFVND